MRVIATIAMVILLASCGGKKSESGQTDLRYASVYVCMSPHAKAYHIFRNCKGLSRCRHGVEEMQEADAIDMGRHLCGYCRERMDD